MRVDLVRGVAHSTCTHWQAQQPTHAWIISRLSYSLKSILANAGQGIKEAVKKLLITFYGYNGKVKPVKLIVYRDGVSEGQFTKVTHFSCSYNTKDVM
jgi:hypothetical protein